MYITNNNLESNTQNPCDHQTKLIVIQFSQYDSSSVTYTGEAFIRVV